MRPKSQAKEEAIRSIALRLIAEEGLENLTMQKLAKEANISPRTIYLKYENKEDLLVKLFIEEVLVAYEKALLEGFTDTMDFAEGARKLWLNTFHYFKNHREAFVLMQYGKTSPLLNKAFQEKNIRQGQFFSPVHRFLERHVRKALPFEAQRALFSAPLMDLIHEHFEYSDRPEQIITEKIIIICCETVVKSLS